MSAAGAPGSVEPPGDRPGEPGGRRWRGLWPVLLGAFWVLVFFAPLADPGTALATRDVPLFHLPLRADFARLAAEGVPAWNPWLHGGQPVLSNPSYGAFYPPSWLVLAVEPPYALGLLVLLHAALAFAGAWHLARQLGCAAWAAALAAVAYLGGGAYLSLTGALTLLFSMAWFPWVLAWGDDLLRRRDRWWTSGIACGTAWGLQLVNGEPVTVVVSGLGLLALAAAPALRRPQRFLRLAVPFVFALLLAAVQLLPALSLLARSARADPLPLERAAAWSMPPERLAELALPRLFGDPTRIEEGLFFGWNLNDRGYPYVISLYPGLLVALLGVSALFARGTARRAAWALALAGGLFLALGRFNPFYPLLYEHLPVVGILRYPEKLVLLATAVLPFAAAAGWQRLLAEREAGRRRAAELPLGLALAALAAALGFVVLLYALPDSGAAWVKSGLPLPPKEGELTRAVTFLRHQGWIAALVAAAAASLLAACRWSRVPTRALAVVAVALLATDLWYHGRRLLSTLPAAELERPPELARRLTGSDHRVFSDAGFSAALDLVPRQGNPGLRHLRGSLARLEPYSGNLWGIPYALHVDYDLTSTRWAEGAHEELRRHELRTNPAFRLLGAWNVGTLLLRPPLEEIERQGELFLAQVISNPYLLPRYRFVWDVEVHRSREEALAAARSGGYRFARLDYWIDPGAAAEPRPRARDARVIEAQEGGARIDVRYQAASPSYLAAAVTYDPNWSATVDGQLLTIHPTAGGWMGLEVPAGEATVELTYRDPWVPVGAGVSLLAVLAAVAVGVWERRAVLRNP